MFADFSEHFDRVDITDQPDAVRPDNHTRNEKADDRGYPQPVQREGHECRHAEKNNQ